MRIVSYYVDKYGGLFEIVRTENNVEIKRVIEGETAIIIGDLIERNILMNMEMLE